MSYSPMQGTVEVDKKDDSGNETGAGEPEVEEDSSFTGYDKTKSFFDNISCEAVERSAYYKIAMYVFSQNKTNSHYNTLNKL